MAEMTRKITVSHDLNRVSTVLSDAKFVCVDDSKDNTISSTKGERLSAREIFYLAKGEYTIKTDGKILDVIVEPVKESNKEVEIARLELSSDAKDFHVVDGVGEIAANGKSFVTITICKSNVQGKPMNGPKDNDTLFFRTDAGIIRDQGGKTEIRSIKLKKGKEAFRLYSENRKRLATVRVFNGDQGVENASIQIEFI